MLFRVTQIHMQQLIPTEEESTSYVVHDKLGDARTQAVEELLATIGREAKKRRRRRTWIKRAAVGVVILATLLTLILESKFKFRLGYYWFIVGAVAVYEVLATRVERKAARTLAELDDPRAVGPLTNALELQGDAFSDGATLRAIKSSLARLLLREEPELTERQLNILVEHALEITEESDLVVGVLRTLERHGHVEAMDSVEPLAEIEGDSEEEHRIQSAAASCLAALKEVERRNKDAGTLLRPSAESANDTLLRVPTTNPVPDSSSLLRPTESA